MAATERLGGAVAHLREHLLVYRHHAEEAARAKRAVAHGFASLLSETAAWSMAVLHVTAAEAHAEAVRAQVKKIDEAVIAPIDMFAAAIDDVRRANDAQNAAAARYREIQDKVASKTEAGQVVPAAELERMAAEAKEKLAVATAESKGALDALFPRRTERFGETILRALVDAEDECAHVLQDGMASWAATVGRTGSAQMVSSEADPALRLASNVWLYVSQLNRSMIQTDGTATMPSTPRAARSSLDAGASADLLAPGDVAVGGAATPAGSMLWSPSLASPRGSETPTPAKMRRVGPLSAEQQLQRYKESLGRNPVSSLAVPTGFEAYPQVARYALAACCHPSELDALLRFQALSADELERCRLRDLAACDLVLNGKALRAANVGEDIVNVQAKETAIRTALVAANGPALAAWSPGRIRGLADVLSMYVGGTHAMHASRIAVQLLFGRRSLVDIVPSLDKADLQRPNELTVQAGRAAISVSFTWWVIEAPPPPPQPPADGGAEEEPPPSVGKYNILGIIDSTYLLRIHIDDTWNTTRPMLGMVFIKRRAVTTSTPRKAVKKSGPRIWCDRTATFRVEADFREVSDGKVHLLKLNGVRVAVPLERLCKADLLHLNMLVGLDVAPYLDLDDTPLSFAAWRSAMPRLEAVAS